MFGIIINPASAGFFVFRKNFILFCGLSVFFLSNRRIKRKLQEEC